MADLSHELTHPSVAVCMHGGAFFDAIGPRFDDLTRREHVINADVLDAWFPPSPRVAETLRAHLDWLLRTSPPTECEGMIAAIAAVRGVPVECVIPGAGSSSLIYLCLREWLEAGSRALVLDPSYGEYRHILERVIGCRVDRLHLPPDDGYRLNARALREAFSRRYDFIVLVNPNSPTGAHFRRAELEPLLRELPAETRLWIDETYVDYVGAAESVEQVATGLPNVIVCKSMSKVYALSGVRAAYLVMCAEEAARLRSISPPWAVSLPGQVAAVKALEDPEYYRERYRETHELRGALEAELDSLGVFERIPSTTNFILCHLRHDLLSAAELVQRCREHGLYVRDATNMGSDLRQSVRFAVKDGAANHAMVRILRQVLQL